MGQLRAQVSATVMPLTWPLLGRFMFRLNDGWRTAGCGLVTVIVGVCIGGGWPLIDALSMATQDAGLILIFVGLIQTLIRNWHGG